LWIATSLAQQQAARYVISVRQGFQATSVAFSDRAQTIAMLRRIRAEGIRFVDPYSKVAVYWNGGYIELVDVQDPQGTAKSAQTIMAEAFPGTISLP
jgi:hypothetical protein